MQGKCILSGMETLKYLQNKILNTIQIKMQNFREQNGKHCKVQVNVIDVQPIENQLSARGGKRNAQYDSGNKDDSDEINKETANCKELNFIYRFVNLLCFPLGIQLKADWKFNILTGMTTFTAVSAVLLDSYTIYTLNGNFFKIVEVVSFLGMLAPGAYKLFLGCTAMQEILSLYNFAEKVYVLNSYGRKAEILSKNAKKITKQIICLICLAIASFCCFGGYPLFKLILHGELIPLLTLQIPGVNQDETSGFVISNLIMMGYGLYGAMGSVAFDVLFALIVLMHSSLVSLVKYDLEQLGHMWQNDDKTVGEDYRNAYLRNIVKQIGDVNRYAGKISDIFSDFIFVQMGSAYLCISMALFAVIINQWISGVGYAVYCFAEMFLICYLGTTLNIQNEELSSMIYDHAWYLYPNRTQKLFVCLLHMVQNSTELTVGSLARLNVETGMKMTNSIYSYLTMLISFIQ